MDRLLQLDALALLAGGIMLGIRWYRTRNSTYMVARFSERLELPALSDP